MSTRLDVIRTAKAMESQARRLQQKCQHMQNRHGYSCVGLEKRIHRELHYADMLRSGEAVLNPC